MNTSYNLARSKYREYNVDTEKTFKILSTIPLSIHCWQGDDVTGFEKTRTGLSGGIQVTGNYPGKARNVAELRADLHKVYQLLPGKHRLNLHAIYGEFGSKRVDRNQIEPKHFRGWIDWAKDEGVKLDFNATLFSHPKVASGLTLSSPDKSIREFWITHVRRCRRIAADMGKSLNHPCIHNLWIPDGSKDAPVDRYSPRKYLKDALDKIYRDKYPSSQMKDALESKLFGIGSESYVVGSHEFYLGYCLKNNKIPCLDLGHFHPTESVADKISAILQFSDEILLHMSRGVRWDSDHVPVLNDEVRTVTEEIIRSNRIKDIHIALDFFDASINRIGAWVLGARTVLKGLLMALLQPAELMRKAESSGDHFSRLALTEEVKTIPFGPVWDYYCHKSGVPTDAEVIKEVKTYEKQVLSNRN
ncbi:MAG: L-rhamnose isomerase [Planctomycetes bacterium]|nr:L-rhamnose isomerase [Planctomycetota bacterium]